jgi:hypothetical protein
VATLGLVVALGLVALGAETGAIPAFAAVIALGQTLNAAMVFWRSERRFGLIGRVLSAISWAPVAAALGLGAAALAWTPAALGGAAALALDSFALGPIYLAAVYAQNARGIFASGAGAARG